jgi:hypothetical protein
MRTLGAVDGSHQVGDFVGVDHGCRNNPPLRKRTEG